MLEIMGTFLVFGFILISGDLYISGYTQVVQKSEWMTTKSIWVSFHLKNQKSLKMT